MCLGRFNFRCEAATRDVKALVDLFRLIVEAESQVKVADVELDGGCDGGFVLFGVAWALFGAHINGDVFGSYVPMYDLFLVHLVED